MTELLARFSARRPLVIVVLWAILAAVAVAVSGQLLSSATTTDLKQSGGADSQLAAELLEEGLRPKRIIEEELNRGLSKQEAVERTGATAGRTVLFSGVTVVIALCGMLISFVLLLPVPGAGRDSREVLGKGNWYLPGFLCWLPDVRVERRKSKTGDDAGSFNSRKNPPALWEMVKVFRPRATVAGARGVRPHPRPPCLRRGRLSPAGRGEN